MCANNLVNKANGVRKASSAMHSHSTTLSLLTNAVARSPPWLNSASIFGLLRAKVRRTKKTLMFERRCDVDSEAVVCRAELDTQPSQLLRDDADMAVVVGVRKVA
jgi:hypothetical protein